MSTTVAPTTLSRQAGPYLAFLESWLAGLADVTCEAQHSAVLAVDVIGGFCLQRALASPRVATMVPPLAALLEAYTRAGGSNVLLTEDAHAPDAREFRA